MGLAPEVPLEVAQGKLPENKVDVTRDKIVGLVLQWRDEMVEASPVAEVVELEVDAQGRSFRPRFNTFAAAADIHARPVPQGVTNGEYRPGATSLEMPTELAGSRTFRVERARDFSSRASAVVDKTRNLVALNAEDALFKYEDAGRKLPGRQGWSRGGDPASQERAPGCLWLSLRSHSWGLQPQAPQNVRIDDILTNEILAAQTGGACNETLFPYAISLAGLQRLTAGGIDAGLSNVVPEH